MTGYNALGFAILVFVFFVFWVFLNRFLGGYVWRSALQLSLFQTSIASVLISLVLTAIWLLLT